MNGKQKKILYLALLVITVSLLFWYFEGGETFTKTEVLVEKTDELFGTTYQEWESRFVWGLDLSLGVSGIAIFLGSIFMCLYRTKKSN